MDTTFRCIGCQIDLPIDRFSRSPALKRGHLSRCKSCTNKMEKQRDKEMRRQNKAMRKLLIDHGITVLTANPTPLSPFRPDNY